MSIFDSLKKYPGSWNVVETKTLKDELGSNIDNLLSMEVVPSDFGISVKFSFKGGYYNYIPVSTENDTLEIGETPELEELVVLTLSREGDDNIYRIDTI